MKNALFAVRILWLISVINWCIFTFGFNNATGMWISLAFQWIFIVASSIIGKKVTAIKIQEIESEIKKSDNNMII